MAKLISKNAIRSMASLYSPSVFRTIVNNNSLASVDNRISKYRCEFIPDDTTVDFENLIRNVYHKMYTNYRNEYVYKSFLFNKLLVGKYSLKTTTLLNEFKVNKSIADVVLVNGAVKLFEIKTDLDSLNRLDNQLQDYKRAVENIYIVTDTIHLKEINKRYADSNYGIIELTNRKTLRTHKDSIPDTSSFDHLVLFKLLRKDEYLSIVYKHFGNVPDVPNTLMYKECLKKLSELDVDVFQRLVFGKIKLRKLANPKLLMDSKTPAELRYLCYVNDLNKKQYQSLHNILRIGI